ncbi:hypothetical protein [Nannocystis sp. SCPEA4]|uniref:TolB family protein n=1 Tax=Nannocystis sp. SCPEA4 TaxID=2996787 RepID=UPI0022717D83|nr:hypothetical protein [Nannocystis sp. SCPEA4]MCY1054181.1 hypothetical protein [Nannocystis sp. SCPEA4]
MTPSSPTGIASTMATGSDSDGTATDAPTTTDGTDSAGPSTGEPTSTTGTPAGCNTLTVDPPEVTIMIDNGVHAPAQLNAFCDGAPVTATWSADASYIASVDEKGLVEAGGQYGGQLVVEALHGNKTAQATVNVFLKVDLVPPEITEADKAILDGATMPDTAVLSYPYDGTVFPKGLSPAELMWHGSTPGDKYLVRYSGQFVDAKIYTLAEPPSRHTITKPLWVQISESSSGLPLNLDVHRLPAGQAAAFVLADDTWTIASEKLIGSVYYWANSLGRVLRINPGADAPEDFLLAGGYDGCSTCHSASANGTRLILGGDIDVSTWDLVNNVPLFSTTAVGKPVRNWAMPAISPDGTVVIENGEGNLPGPPGASPGMWDAITGVKLMGTGIDDLVLNMPAFSSDGRKIAYVDHTTLSLMALDYDAVARTASNPVKLVDPGPDVTMNGIIFPSVTPDGRYVIYHRGAYPAMLDTRNGTSDMFLASIEQPGTEIRLRAGNGDDYGFYAGDRDRHWNYEPTFAPRASGGYNWAVFTSRRTFGNKLEGGKDAVKQLWLVAIDENPQPGVDPSHPAFWLHGQDVNTLNMRGFWVHKNDDPGG